MKEWIIYVGMSAGIFISGYVGLITSDQAVYGILCTGATLLLVKIT